MLKFYRLELETVGSCVLRKTAGCYSVTSFDELFLYRKDHLVGAESTDYLDWYSDKCCRAPLYSSGIQVVY